MSEPSLRSLPSAPLLGAPRARPSQWEAAFAAHYVALCEYVLRFVGSAETAEDIVQDLFLHLWDTRGPRDVLRLTRRYLHVAARNPDVGAVSAFYGGGSPNAEAFAKSKAANRP